MFAKINVLGGDIKSGKWTVVPLSNVTMFIGEGKEQQTLNFEGQVYQVEVQTEEKLKKLSGSAGWGFTGAIVGGLLTGGVGLLAGLLGGVLAGGNKTEICFSCELKDTRKFIAVTDAKTYQKLLALTYGSA